MIKNIVFLASIIGSVFGASSLRGNSSVATTATTFNLNEANKHLWLSAAAYCGAEGVKTHTFKGVTTGFVVTYTFDDHLDTQGYVGYLPSDSAIYVVFRGSSSIQNWITNLKVTKTEYEGYCCGKACEVHKGFYNAEQSVIDGILSQVKSLKTKYPSYSVKLTGHSLGAALSTLTAMDLKANGIAVATLYNFGEPRVGDTNFATCAASYIPTVRVTHLKDTVPHIPYQSWGYNHICREAYESSTTSTNPTVKDCSTSNCDDPACAEQWEFRETNIDDHLTYLGLRVSCEAVTF